MTSAEFRASLLARAEHAGVAITDDTQRQLEAYFRLLARWNPKVNLTALPLERPTDQTFDRLLIEPLVAAEHVAAAVRGWFDVGSGGGSPAIPLKIACPDAQLTMIEARERKAAFLCEAVRALGLNDARVENHRFEDVECRTDPKTIDLVTVRAVRGDPHLLSAICRVLSPSGRVFLFHSSVSELNALSSLDIVGTVRLGTGADAMLSILKPRVP